MAFYIFVAPPFTKKPDTIQGRRRPVENQEGMAARHIAPSVKQFVSSVCTRCESAGNLVLHYNCLGVGILSSDIRIGNKVIAPLFGFPTVC